MREIKLKVSIRISLKRAKLHDVGKWKYEFNAGDLCAILDATFST